MFNIDYRVMALALVSYVLFALALGCSDASTSGAPPAAALPPVQIQMAESGTGRNILVLHGGGGPATMTTLVSHLSQSAHVLLPTHPGFQGTERPSWLTTPADLADVYVRYLVEHNLNDVIVIGSSLGGWLAVEMALRDPSHRVAGIVVIDGLGVNIPGQPITNITGFTPQQIAQVACHDPSKCLPAGPPPSDAQIAIARGNQAALAVYAGDTYGYDPTLLDRARGIHVSTTMIWGDSDHVVTPDYGRAYSAAISNAQFAIVANAGHLPWLENPADTFRIVDGIVTATAH